MINPEHFNFIEGVKKQNVVSETIENDNIRKGPNQDTFSVNNYSYIRSDGIMVKYLLACVFDGHDEGGEIISNIVNQALPEILSNKITEKKK